MEYITTQDLFVGELNTILNTECSVDEVMDLFIKDYEPKILKKILGQEFFNALQTELGSGLSGEWDVLVNGGDFTIDGVTHQFAGLKHITAGFIFYWYHRNNAYNVADTGASAPLRDGGVVKSMAFKQRSAWNKSVELTSEGCDSLWSFLDNSSLDNYEKNNYGEKINGLQWL